MTELANSETTELADASTSHAWSNRFIFFSNEKRYYVNGSARNGCDNSPRRTRLNIKLAKRGAVKEE